jgi:hypothetical protein
MSLTPNLSPLFFQNTSSKFEYKKVTATAATGLTTYPMYYGYRTIVHDVYKNIPLKESLKDFLKKEITSLSKFPFFRLRHLREICLFHTDNACCDMAQNSINNNNAHQLGSILALTTLFSSLEISQLGYRLSVMRSPKLFIPIMIRQIGTLATINCGKHAANDPSNPLYIQAPLALGALSTIAQNIFLKNVSKLSSPIKSINSLNPNVSPNRGYNLNTLLSNSAHILQSAITKRNVHLFFASSVSRAVFGSFSGALYEYIYNN